MANKRPNPRMTGNPRPFNISITDPKARIQAFIDSYSDNEGYETPIMHSTRILTATHDSPSQASATFETTISPSLCSAMHNMHGGAIATLADMVTTMTAAPIAETGWWEFSGVSRTLNVTFLKPIPAESVVVSECVLRSVGRRLSVIQCVMKDKGTGALLALAEHGKAALEEQTKGRL